MSKKKIAHLNSQTLYEMGDTLKVQGHQLSLVESEKDAISDGIDYLNDNISDTKRLSQEATEVVDELLSSADIDDNILQQLLNGLSDDINNGVTNNTESYAIPKTESILTGNEWDKYMDSVSQYAEAHAIDTSDDPFVTMLSQREYEELDKAINDDFAKKTSIRNKTDLAFLAIAIALQTTKSLLYPYFAKNAGFGDKIDTKNRLDHKDKNIKHESKQSHNA